MPDDALRDALLAAWLNLVVSLELSDDDLVDPGFVADALGDLTTDLGALASTDRALLVELIRRRAATETDPSRRAILDETPENFGLTDG